jgi:hypothetical protein
MTNPIHIKLEYVEAVKSKKDILSSEMNLLRILKIIKRYHSLRIEELKIKTKLHRKIKETITNIKKIETSVPKIKIPEILKKDEEGEIKINPKIKSKTNYKNDIEEELLKIQKKLNSLTK